MSLSETRTAPETLEQPATPDLTAEAPDLTCLDTGAHKPKVVVIGAGFGGLSAVLRLRNTPAEITVIDRHNYHLFQPLLYQVATAGLSPADISAPIRSVLSRQKNARVILDTVTGIDRAGRCVNTGHGRCIPYDYLIVATGATHGYFGKDHWEEHAPGIKTIDDATNVRRKILLAFEKAEMASTEKERDAYLNFTIVGGGPTGVELAGAIAELAHHTLSYDFHNIKPGSARIRLIDAGPRVLSAFPEELSRKAQKALERMGVELVFNTMVTDVGESHVMTADECIPCHTVIWAAGVRASPAAEWLGVETDRSGRVPVTDTLSLKDDENIFVVGDTALYQPDPETPPLPGVAPVAKQMGKFAASWIDAKIRGRALPTFTYQHYGNLATIGRKAAVCDFGAIKVTGYAGWWLWGIAHIYFLIGFRNRFVVILNWIWSYLTFQRGIRLITGDSQSEKELTRKAA